ncbi:hypothetical protein STAS_26384 [Striga asiatica]|uniref:Uncharacterized protein n=1 Tax=Striga asiatica TaxID=4170 RepID=A0A5A7QYV9_STRAF|nr:hypothetical protein STAS_26384 [Striga asiatica]
MHTDDSFKKPGSIPFKWEIRPGVPKIQPENPSLGPARFDSSAENRRPKLYRKQLKPPPAGFNFRPHLEARPSPTQSPLGNVSRRLGPFGRAQPDIVSSSGCFPASPLVKRKNKKVQGPGPRSKPEPGYCSDPDIPSRWSVSSRKSTTTASPLSSSMASYQSSPRPVRDVDWAGFGLF